jgi:hypothetical protein
MTTDRTFLQQIEALIPPPPYGFHYMYNARTGDAPGFIPLPADCSNYRLGYVAYLFAPHPKQDPPREVLAGAIALSVQVAHADGQTILGDELVQGLIADINDLYRALRIQMHSLRTTGRLTSARPVPGSVVYALIPDFGELPIPPSARVVAPPAKPVSALAVLGELEPYPALTQPRDLYAAPPPMSEEDLRRAMADLDAIAEARSRGISPVPAMKILMERAAELREEGITCGGCGREQLICRQAKDGGDIPNGQSLVKCWRCGWTPISAGGEP